MKESNDLNTTELPYAEGLYLLKVVYLKIIEILDVVCSQNVLIRNEELNFYYVNFTQLIDAVLDSKGFEELKEKAPRIYETIIGDLNDADVEWPEKMSRECYEYYGIIEKEYITSGVPPFEFPEVLVAKLNRADELIEEHKSTATRVFNSMLNKAKKNKQEREKENKVKQIPNITFDSATSTLRVDDLAVKLTKNAYRTQILGLLMKSEKNMLKEWEWEEIVEVIQGDVDFDELKREKKRFYPACDGLSKHIALKTGLNDFLIYNKSTVQINPKYITQKVS